MNGIKEQLAKNKKILMILFGAIIAFLLYSFVYLPYKNKDTDGGFIREENTSITQSEMGREIVSTLNRLKSINIDPDFFDDPRFVRLIDFSVELEKQPVGRQNPFREIDVIQVGDVESDESQVIGSVENNQTNFNSGSSDAIVERSDQ